MTLLCVKGKNLPELNPNKSSPLLFTRANLYDIKRIYQQLKEENISYISNCNLLTKSTEEVLVMNEDLKNALVNKYQYREDLLNNIEGSIQKIEQARVDRKKNEERTQQYKDRCFKKKRHDNIEEINKEIESLLCELNNIKKYKEEAYEEFQQEASTQEYIFDLNSLKNDLVSTNYDLTLQAKEYLKEIKTLDIVLEPTLIELLDDLQSTMKTNDQLKHELYSYEMTDNASQTAANIEGLNQRHQKLLPLFMELEKIFEDAQEMHLSGSQLSVPESEIDLTTSHEFTESGIQVMIQSPSDLIDIPQQRTKIGLFEEVSKTFSFHQKEKNIQEPIKRPISVASRAPRRILKVQDFINAEELTNIYPRDKGSVSGEKSIDKSQSSSSLEKRNRILRTQSEIVKSNKFAFHDEIIFAQSEANQDAVFSDTIKEKLIELNNQQDETLEELELAATRTIEKLKRKNKIKSKNGTESSSNEESKRERKKILNQIDEDGLMNPIMDENNELGSKGVFDQQDPSKTNDDIDQEDEEVFDSQGNLVKAIKKKKRNILDKEGNENEEESRNEDIQSGKNSRKLAKIIELGEDNTCQIALDKEGNPIATNVRVCDISDKSPRHSRRKNRKNSSALAHHEDDENDYNESSYNYSDDYEEYDSSDENNARIKEQQMLRARKIQMIRNRMRSSGTFESEATLSEPDEKLFANSKDLSQQRKIINDPKVAGTRRRSNVSFDASMEVNKRPSVVQPTFPDSPPPSPPRSARRKRRKSEDYDYDPNSTTDQDLPNYNKEETPNDMHFYPDPSLQTKRKPSPPRYYQVQDVDNSMAPPSAGSKAFVRSVVQEAIAKSIDRKFFENQINDARIILTNIHGEIQDLNDQLSIMKFEQQNGNLANNFCSIHNGVISVYVGPSKPYVPHISIATQSIFDLSYIQRLEEELNNNVNFLAAHSSKLDQYEVQKARLGVLGRKLTKLNDSNAAEREQIAKMENRIRLVMPLDDKPKYDTGMDQVQYYENLLHEHQEKLRIIMVQIEDNYNSIKRTKAQIEDQRCSHDILKRQIMQVKQQPKPDIKKMCTSLEVMRNSEKRGKAKLQQLMIEEKYYDSLINMITDVSVSPSLDADTEKLQQMKQQYQKMNPARRMKLIPRQEIQSIEQRHKEVDSELLRLKKAEASAKSKIESLTKELKLKNINCPQMITINV